MWGVLPGAGLVPVLRGEGARGAGLLDGGQEDVGCPGPGHWVLGACGGSCLGLGVF